jgi:hypothetical protein
MTTTRTAFSDTEWKLIQEAPMLAGAVIPALDFGVVKAVKESKAILDSMENLRAIHARHAFLREVFALEEMPDVGKQDDPRAFLLGRVRDAVQLMRANASPDDYAAYARGIVQLAEKVASASGSGWFGFGARISDAERAYLDELAAIVA